MANKKQTMTKRRNTEEMDGVYLLKLVLYVVLGSQWLWLQRSSGQDLPIPVGLFIGLLFAMHDHFKIDRKIEFAVLLVATLFGYLAHMGLFVSL